MNQKERIKGIAFIDPSLKKAFEELKSGKYEEQQLTGFLNRAIEDIICNWQHKLINNTTHLMYSVIGLFAWRNGSDL